MPKARKVKARHMTPQAIADWHEEFKQSRFHRGGEQCWLCTLLKERAHLLKLIKSVSQYVESEAEGRLRAVAQEIPAQFPYKAPATSAAGQEPR